MLTYISNSAHYKEVLSRVMHVKQSLWIGTADIKDLYIEYGAPFLYLCNMNRKLYKGESA